ncbi:MAG: glycosyltransferase family 2 protein [Akkermansiaceae bacterium]
MKLSVFIICCNEEDRIEQTISSAKGFADEIIVVDSGSTDRTIEVATAAGADQVVSHPWEGYGQQKRFAEDLCKHDWILNLDADEALTEASKDEIRSLFEDGEPKTPCWRIPITQLYPFEDEPCWAAHTNSPIRLYHKGYARFRDDAVHDSVIFHSHIADQQTGMLKNYIEHRSLISLTHTMRKIAFYSEHQAQKMFAQGKKPSMMRIIIEPFAAFTKNYILRKFFAYGGWGISLSMVYAAGRVLRLARARELYLIDKHNKKSKKLGKSD